MSTSSVVMVLGTLALTALILLFYGLPSLLAAAPYLASAAMGAFLITRLRQGWRRVSKIR